MSIQGNPSAVRKRIRSDDQCQIISGNCYPNNTEKHVKKELVLKETNYSQNYVFLDVLDNLNSTYVVDFFKLLYGAGEYGIHKKCCCHGL